MSKKYHEQKANEVSLLSQKLKNCSSFLIYEYAGFTANEVSVLRSKLHQSGFKMKVYKNNILNRALKEAQIIVDANFSGPNALVMGGEDIQPLKEIAKMADKKTFIKLKAAFVDNNLILDQNLASFATLPTKKDLYVMICQTLQAPLRKLMLTLQAVAEK